MGKNRLEAFSDGVIAIIITIMVLELKVPHGHELRDLLPLWPKFLSYTLSFVYVGIYWNNHHHLWHAASKVNGAVLWANLLLLFFLSLVPFATDWMGESHFAAQPVATYGILLFLTAIAFLILVNAMLRVPDQHPLLAKAIGKDRKGKLSILIYVVGIAGTFINPWIGFAMYFVVAMIWLIPDTRIEKRLTPET